MTSELSPKSAARQATADSGDITTAQSRTVSAAALPSRLPASVDQALDSEQKTGISSASLTLENHLNTPKSDTSALIQNVDDLSGPVKHAGARSEPDGPTRQSMAGASMEDVTHTKGLEPKASVRTLF